MIQYGECMPMFDAIFNEDMKKLLELLGKLKKMQQSGASIKEIREVLDDEFLKRLPPEQTEGIRSISDKLADIEKGGEPPVFQSLGAEGMPDEARMARIIEEKRKEARSEAEADEIETLLKRSTGFMKAVSEGADPTVAVKDLLDDEYLKREAPEFVGKMQGIVDEVKGFAKKAGIDTAKLPTREETGARLDKLYKQVFGMQDPEMQARREGLKRLLPPGTPIGYDDNDRTEEFVHLFAESFIARLRGEEPPMIRRLRESSDDQLLDTFPEGFVRVQHTPHPVVRGTLKVWNCDILSTSEIVGLEFLVHIEGLSLRNTLIEDLNLPPSLYNLRTIDVKNNRIREAHGLEELCSVRALDVSRNRIESLDALHFGDTMESLEALVIDHNPFPSLDGIAHFPHLSRLSALDNGITVLPADISRLEALVSVNLGWNRLAAVPDKLPTSVRKLALPCNEIRSFDDALFPDGLEVLDLTGNGLGSVAFTRAFPALRELRLARTHLERVAGLENCPNLEVLDLNTNCLAELPDLTGLTQLTHLDLSYNQMRDVNWDKVKAMLREEHGLEKEGNGGGERQERG